MYAAYFRNPIKTYLVLNMYCTTVHLLCSIYYLLLFTKYYITLMIYDIVLLLCSSVSTIRNQRYHIHANLSFAILVAEILLLISARFDPGTVGTQFTTDDDVDDEYRGCNNDYDHENYKDKTVVMMIIMIK